MIHSVDGNSQDDNAARHYDPETGRWLNVEPVGYQADDAQLYRYPANTASADPKT